MWSRNPIYPILYAALTLISTISLYSYDEDSVTYSIFKPMMMPMLFFWYCASTIVRRKPQV